MSSSLRGFLCKVIFIIVWSCLLLILSMMYPVQYYLYQSPLASYTFGSFFRAQAMVSGAQESLLLTKACEVGIFEVVEELTNKKAAIANLEGPTKNGERNSHRLRSLFSGWIGGSEDEAASACPTVEEIYMALQRKHESGRNHEEAMENKRQRNDVRFKISHRSVLTLLEALSAVGLVTLCDPQQKEKASSSNKEEQDFLRYQLTSIAAQYFAPLSAGDDYLCDLTAVVNDRVVVRYLLDAYGTNADMDDNGGITDTTSGDERTMLKRRRSNIVHGEPDSTRADEEKRLWQKFSEKTGVYQRKASLLSAENVLEHVNRFFPRHKGNQTTSEEEEEHKEHLSEKATHSRQKLRVGDIGCGSGQQLFTIAEYVPPCDGNGEEDGAVTRKHGAKPSDDDDIGGGGRYFPSPLEDGVSGRFCLQSAVQFDLPAVIQTLENGQKGAKSLNMETLWSFIGGSIFSDEDVNRLTEKLLLPQPESASEVGDDEEEVDEEIVIIFMNSFLQHFDHGTSVAIVQSLQRAVQQTLSKKLVETETVERGGGGDAAARRRKTRRGTEKVFLAVTELVVQRRGQYVPAKELVPMAQLFNFVLDAMTSGGSVRTAQEYAEILHCVSNPDDEYRGGRDDGGKSSKGEQKDNADGDVDTMGGGGVAAVSLFPFPASLFIVELN